MFIVEQHCQNVQFLLLYLHRIRSKLDNQKITNLPTLRFNCNNCKEVIFIIILFPHSSASFS